MAIGPQRCLLSHSREQRFSLASSLLLVVRSRLEGSPLPLGVLELRSKLRIAVVTLRARLSRLDSSAYRTIRLGKMSAIPEAAPVEERPQLGKTRIEMLRRHSPHSDFAETRGIDDVAAIR